MMHKHIGLAILSFFIYIDLLLMITLIISLWCR
jgi:hypothetical protein